MSHRVTIQYVHRITQCTVKSTTSGGVQHNITITTVVQNPKRITIHERVYNNTIIYINISSNGVVQQY